MKTLITNPASNACDMVVIVKELNTDEIIEKHTLKPMDFVAVELNSNRNIDIFEN